LIRDYIYVYVYQRKFLCALMFEEIYGTKNVYYFISKICNRTNGKDNGFMWTEQCLYKSNFANYVDVL